MAVAAVHEAQRDAAAAKFAEKSAHIALLELQIARFKRLHDAACAPEASVIQNLFLRVLGSTCIPDSDAGCVGDVKMDRNTMVKPFYCTTVVKKTPPDPPTPLL
mgnify:CR=1 FL=1